ncbi:monovalent cation/H+ antiporter subunit A [Chitinivorax sp. PXF-14]|uniref:monovalent cation/H+ antiporter subunit A n=1 Tax=Chitinivorax sp. PXF-14 TaxID=3230488 RepID=UPI003465B05E
MLLLFLLLPFLGALLMPATVWLGQRTAAWLAGAVSLAGFVWLLWHAPWPGLDFSLSLPWMPAIGLAFSLRLDGLAFLFGLMITGIGALVVLYARYYLHHGDSRPRFYATLLLFMGAMLGVVLADNLLLLLVFWELTSLSSFLLIGYWHERTAARQGARMALTVTGLGGLALLAGVLILGDIADSFAVRDVIAARAAIIGDPRYPLALGLILLGAFTKSAQFPFHFWLPQAMAAPTPVSSYLHSATMVKAGVFLLARLYPALGHTDWWFALVAPVGLATLLVGAYFALYRDDIKGLLAYSTISHLGLITLLFGLDTELSAIAALFHIVNHATFKASLFMTAGIVDHEAGTRDMRVLGGLARYMPYTATLATVAACAMAGVPLLNGFLSKEMFYDQTLQAAPLGPSNLLLPALAWLGTAFSVAYSLRFVHAVFFRRSTAELPRIPHEPPRWMRIPVELLVLLCVAVGLAPHYTVDTVLRLAARSVVGETLPPFELALWHGINPPLIMSVLALLTGLALYRWMAPVGRIERTVPTQLGSRIFSHLQRRLLSLAGRLDRAMQHPGLRAYLLWLVLAALVAGWGGWWLADAQWMATGATWQQSSWGFLALAALAAVSALLAVWWRKRRVLALAAVGVTGLMVAWAFVQFSSPDLALTQVAIEVATSVLMLLALRWLPHASDSRPDPIPVRLRDAVLAVLAGAGMFGILLAVLGRPLEPISGFYLEHALSLGGGANVVNVILVDFRGYDTLGEVTVLALAGLLLAKLLEDYSLRTGPGPHDSLLLAIGARLLLPFALMVSLYLFLRGHQQPGGGFVAGLVTAAALVSQSLAFGLGWSHNRLRLHATYWSATGLLLALVTGLGSLGFDANFLTSSHGHLHLPLLGEIEWASAALFDLGVYLVVVGATMSMLGKLAGTQDPHAEKGSI